MLFTRSTTELQCKCKLIAQLRSCGACSRTCIGRPMKEGVTPDRKFCVMCPLLSSFGQSSRASEHEQAAPLGPQPAMINRKGHQVRTADVGIAPCACNHAAPSLAPPFTHCIPLVWAVLSGAAGAV